MRKIGLSFLILFYALSVFSQGDRVLDKQGNLLYQYHRSAVPDPENPGSLIVTFVFGNGNRPNAISLRQEKMYANVQWLDTANAATGTEEIVASITANLKPNESVTWKYVFIPQKKNSKTIHLECAALLIMNERFEIKKIPIERVDYMR